MLRSPSVLPGCKEKEKLMRNRQVLSASISAEALIVHEEKSKPSRRPVQFAITDILPGNQKTGKKVEAAALPASLTTLGPLSLPRPGKSDALSPTNGTERNPPAAPKLKKELASPVQISSSLENYAERLEKAENTELFAYASALCHRVTGRYLPRTLLQSDPEAQQRELERVQHDPEILRAIDSDGIPRFVSKSALHKMMWRRFNAFVACKNCGGRPIPKAAKTNPFGKYPQDGSSEDVDVWSVAKGKKHTKKVEYDTAMYDGQRIMEISGNRLAVRAEMRRVMLASEKPDSSVPSIHAPESDNGVQRPSPPRIVVDVHKVLRLLMNALEQRRDGIKRDLTALFDAGDLNHDCVLTLDEFGAIIRKRKPHFSDRRILRMFREALMGGVDQSFALSMEAFVVVCNDHGLVSLLPDDRMVDPFAVSSKLVPKNSGPEIARTTDSPVSVVPEIPEDIPGELPTARAEEVDEDGDEGGGNQRQTRENAEAVAN
ncbi:hypothetical protein PR001_g12507 [Phytophthora rubi]|uniref:EF-hand domain-containing protein n=1 Tax=Phytophthora rubi TaxID=129364 RepID=A0A6A3MAD1_9STRA|nr:hypothetical protein PR001_g12507 [Phytophthora rubi]